MPHKQPSLFDVEGVEPPKPKPPTIAQFLKEQKDVEFPVLTLIETIWLPGNWDNFSVNGEKFRASISARHPLYPLLDKQIVSLVEKSDTGILLGLLDGDGTLRFIPSEVYGVWKRIGNAGYRFERTPLN